MELPEWDAIRVRAQTSNARSRALDIVLRAFFDLDQNSCFLLLLQHQLEPPAISATLLHDAVSLQRAVVAIKTSVTPPQNSVSPAPPSTPSHTLTL